MPSASSGCWRSGVDAEQIARIHAPIGLDIGASSPAEIAVAVLARDHPARCGRAAPAAARRTKRREVRAGRDRRCRGRDPRARRPMPATGASARRIVLTADDVAELKQAGVAEVVAAILDAGRSRRERGRRRASPQGMRVRRRRGRSRRRPAASTCMRAAAGVFTVDTGADRRDQPRSIRRSPSPRVAEYAAVEARPDGGDGEDHPLRGRRRRWSRQRSAICATRRDLRRQCRSGRCRSG